MNPARVFALQATKSSRPDVSAGGKTEVDQATAAALCAGMRREWYLAGRLKWAIDYSVSEELSERLIKYARKLQSKERWRNSSEEKLSRLAILAVAEMMEPRAYKHNNIKALFIGVDKSNYSRTWEKRYNAVYQELDEMANRAFSYIMMKQRYADD